MPPLTRKIRTDTVRAVRLRGSFLFVAVGLLLAGQLASGAQANIKEYEVTGTSQGKDGKPAAEKPAEDDALKTAVEKGVMELAGEKVAAEKKEELRKILAKPRRYIPEFRVVDRSEAGTTVILKVRAKVNLDSLRGDLITAGVIVLEAPEKVPITRVVVLPGPSKDGVAPWWAEGGAANAPSPMTYVFVDVLRARGFDVVEPRRQEADPDASPKPTPAPQAEMSKENLTAVAKSLDVDVAVKVPWEVQAAARTLDGITYALARAKLGGVEALARDGSVVATVSGEGVAGEALDPSRVAGTKVPADVAQRISDAALASAAREAAARLTAALGEPVAKGGSAATVKLVVAGLDSWVVYDRFERVLTRDLKSVRSATLHSIERGEATFELSLERGKDAAGLADEIEKKDFEQFSVKVTEKSAERLVVHVVR